MRQSHPRRNLLVRFVDSIVDEIAFVIRRVYYRLRYQPPKVRLPRVQLPRVQLSRLRDVRLPNLRHWRFIGSPRVGDLLHHERPTVSRQLLRHMAQLLKASRHYAQQGWQWLTESVPTHQRRIVVGIGILVSPVILGALVPMVVQSGIGMWHDVEDAWENRFSSNDGIADFFAPSVQHWRDDIITWANDYALDPNLLATVMQIESCGHPTVVSHAGAQGLFQVMPFHFEANEDMLDPATNAQRGASFLAFCQQSAGGDAGLAMACYNGGPSVLGRSFGTWANETQRYYLWGTGMYREAISNPRTSITLDSWRNAGGSSLCQRADVALQ